MLEFEKASKIEKKSNVLSYEGKFLTCCFFIKFILSYSIINTIEIYLFTIIAYPPINISENPHTLKN